MTIKECSKVQKKIYSLFVDYTTMHHALSVSDNINVANVLEYSETITKIIRKLNKIAIELGIISENEEMTNKLYDLLHEISTTEKDFLVYCLNNNMID